MTRTKKSGRADGRKSVTFTFQGQRYYVYGNTMKEAREKADRKKAELKEGAYASGGQQQLDRWFETWQRNREGKVSENSAQKYRFQFKTISAAPIDRNGRGFGSLKLSEITRQDVLDLQRTLSDKLTTNSTNQSIGLLFTILRDAVRGGLIPRNPAADIERLRRTEPEARDTIHRALTDEELTAFFGAAERSWYYWFYRFLLFSGVRIGEAGALFNSDIGKNGIISIQRTLTRDSTGARVVGKTAKTKKGVRKIEYTAQLREAVERQRELEKAIRGNVIGINTPIFLSERGSLILSSNIADDIRKICAAAGIEPFGAHAFRDTYATRAIASGMDPKVLQEVLGHSSITMTMDLYAHTMEDRKREQMRAVVIGL